MSGIGVIIAGVVAFTVVILALVAIILVARATLVPSGAVKIEINGDKSKTLTVPTGGKLLGTLADQKIFVPSACGGGGSCGQCKVRVISGGGEILPTEIGHMSRKEIKTGVRLACQTPVHLMIAADEVTDDVIAQRTKRSYDSRLNQDYPFFLIDYYGDGMSISRLAVDHAHLLEIGADGKVIRPSASAGRQFPLEKGLAAALKDVMPAFPSGTSH